MERFRTLADDLGLKPSSRRTVGLKPSSRRTDGWEWFRILNVKSCRRALSTPGMNATDGLLSPEDVLRLCVLSMDPFRTQHEGQLWAIGGKLGKRLVLCPKRGQLVDAIVDALYKYEFMRRAIDEIILEQYHEDNAALPSLLRRLEVPWLLRTQEKLPSSSPLKGLHMNTLRCATKQILDIARAVSLDDYKELFSGFNFEPELKNELFCAMQAAFTSYGPHNYPKVAANYAIASMLVCLGVEHETPGKQKISNIAEQLRKRKSRRQS